MQGRCSKPVIRAVAMGWAVALVVGAMACGAPTDTSVEGDAPATSPLPERTMGTGGDAGGDVDQGDGEGGTPRVTAHPEPSAPPGGTGTTTPEPTPPAEPTPPVEPPDVDPPDPPDPPDPTLPPQPEEPGPDVSPLGNAARIDAHTLPGSLLAGQQHVATVTVRNTGVTTWHASELYYLGSPDDRDPFAYARVDLPVSEVPPGAQVRFDVRLVAPAAPGVYRTDWRMLREHHEWFGETAALDVDVQDSGCSNPVPPPLERMRGVIHHDQGWKKVLDSTPLVYGREYCASIGFTDGRSFCPPRPEGHPEVEVCNEVVVGRAADTGRIGPTWTFNGQPCVDAAEDYRCVNHRDNQFLVFVFGPGTAQACAASGVCVDVPVP